MFDCSSASSCCPSNSRPPLLSRIGTREVDESLFGKRKSNRSKMLGCQWVLGGVCHETGECFLEPVNHRRRSTLVPLIQGHVLTGSTITTYAWRSYRLADHNTNCLVNNVFPFTTHDFFPTTGQLFYPASVEMWGLEEKK
ncbi:hypothetical protein M514_09955 [Trichuris suis]|uniref:ISXO2-like transposase domain-containing protein n=1 Tax=Trichuris suis TaxID=68888 RepID=A0A085MUN4_9BILA|nr:hypothetical protein M513_09955 [Trichuris suis]KFD60930.1 hypothetical protein M514_09955 [Trichuris suis]